MSGGITAIQARIAAIESRFEPSRTTGGVLGGTASATDGATATTSRLADGSVPSDFASVFQDALGQAGTGSATTAAATLRSAGTTSPAAAGARTPAVRQASYGKLEPPAELKAFGNGRIPAAALTSIGHGSHRLYAPAARAFLQMEAAAKADGVTIGVTDTYRSYDAQVDLAKRKGLYSQGGLAATPGTSNHGWGLATDLDLDAKALAWMRQNAPDFGFVEDTPREPWHWTYRPAGGSPVR